MKTEKIKKSSEEPSLERLWVISDTLAIIFFYFHMQQQWSGARVVRTLSDGQVADSVCVVMVDFPGTKGCPCVAIKFVGLTVFQRPLKTVIREYEYLRAFQSVPHSVGSYGACIVTPTSVPSQWAKLCPGGQPSLAIVMPYIHGQTLREYLRARCITLAPLIENDVEHEVSAVLIPVARFCHQLETQYGHYHGDIKMGNIMISPSGRETWIIDMAYASPLKYDDFIPWSRGTPCYMAPEKVRMEETRVSLI
jgi:serine/threonine protein kinase